MKLKIEKTITGYKFKNFTIDKWNQLLVKLKSDYQSSDYFLEINKNRLTIFRR